MIRYICKICDFSDRLNLKGVAYLMFIVGAVLALFSLVAWPLLFVWPAVFILGLLMAFGHGICSECEIPHDHDSGADAT